MADDGIVVTFRPAARCEVRRTMLRPTEPTCMHRGVMLIDEQAREVQCEACGATLDPIKCLAVLANQRVEEDCRAREAAELNALLMWLMTQEGGRLVITRSRAEARAEGVTKSSAAGSPLGGELGSALNAVRAVAEVFRWRQRKAEGEP